MYFKYILKSGFIMNKSVHSYLKTFSGLLVGLIVLFSYQNCGEQKLGPADSMVAAGSSSSSENIVYPEKVCGKEGYQFLLDLYVKEFCAKCHDDGELGELKLTSADFEVAYTAALTVGKAAWIETITHNRFCADEGCNLKPGEKKYNAVVEWLDNRYSCN
jgi:hypothetical protein